MGVWYHGDGKIVLKKECADEFVKAVSQLFNDAHNNRGDEYYELVHGVFFKFSNYARHYFLWELIDIIKDNVDKIDSGQIWFNCDDEDCFNDEHGFPFIIFVEIKDGKVYEESLHRRLHSDWTLLEGNEDWHSPEQIEERRKYREKVERQIEEAKLHPIQYNDDDLPF